MLLSITLEKIVGAGLPYFLEASSARPTSLLLVHSGLWVGFCGSTHRQTIWTEISIDTITAAACKYITRELKKKLTRLIKGSNKPDLFAMGHVTHIHHQP